MIHNPRSTSLFQIGDKVVVNLPVDNYTAIFNAEIQKISFLGSENQFQLVLVNCPHEIFKVLEAYESIISKVQSSRFENTKFKCLTREELVAKYNFLGDSEYYLIIGDIFVSPFSPLNEEVENIKTEIGL